MPFYSLDVSGYQSLLFKARKITVGDDGDSKLVDNKYVTLKSLRLAFSENPLWVKHL